MLDRREPVHHLALFEDHVKQHLRGPEVRLVNVLVDVSEVALSLLLLLLFLLCLFVDLAWLHNLHLLVLVLLIFPLLLLLLGLSHLLLHLVVGGGRVDNVPPHFSDDVEILACMEHLALVLE